MMQTSQNGEEHIKLDEGLKLKAYPCSAGVWTIGYGSTEYPDGRKVKQGDKITLSQAATYLQHDLRQFTVDFMVFHQQNRKWTDGCFFTV